MKFLIVYYNTYAVDDKLWMVIKCRGEMMPEISVLTSVYNCENYLESFLDSILNQTFKDIELIIVNDGSTDRSREIIEGCKDKRIKLYNLEENKGVAKALNFGIKKCNGKYIAKADADDVYTYDRLEKQKNIFDENSDIDVVGTLIRYFPDNKDVRESLRYKSFKHYYEHQANSIISSKDISRIMYMYICLIHSTMMIREDVLKTYLYDEKYYNFAEDYKLLYELNKKGYKMAKVNEVKSYIRVRHSSITAQTNTINSTKFIFDIKKQEIERFKKEEIYIWGYGSYGKTCYKLLKEDYNIMGFIDKFIEKNEKNEYGLHIYNPDVTSKLDKKAKILVASTTGRLEISKYLDDRGYKHLNDYLVL